MTKLEDDYNDTDRAVARVLRGVLKHWLFAAFIAVMAVTVRYCAGG